MKTSAYYDIPKLFKNILIIVFNIFSVLYNPIYFILCIKNNYPEEKPTVSARLPKESKGTKMLRTSSLALLV